MEQQTALAPIIADMRAHPAAAAGAALALGAAAGWALTRGRAAANSRQPEPSHDPAPASSGFRSKLWQGAKAVAVAFAIRKTQQALLRRVDGAKALTA